MLANVRLLASMGANVHCQGASLDEALVASWRRTGIGPLIGVYSVVPLEIRLAVEALPETMLVKLVAATIARSEDTRAGGLPCCILASRTGKGARSARSRQAP